MLERASIENLLKVNGVAVSAPDQEIKSILISARWHEKDIETALMVLRENPKSHQTHVDTLYKVFQTGDDLRPEAISALLGIDVVVPKSSVSMDSKLQKYGVDAGQVIQISVVSICLALFFILGSMWYMHMGVFHITMR